MEVLTPVILSGGSGTRLWPASRRQYPKQFLPHFGEKTLFQATVERAMSLPNSLIPIVVANYEHRFIVAEQLREIGAEKCEIIQHK